MLLRAPEAVFPIPPYSYPFSCLQNIVRSYRSYHDYRAVAPETCLPLIQVAEDVSNTVSMCPGEMLYGPLDIFLTLRSICTSQNIGIKCLRLI